MGTYFWKDKLYVMALTGGNNGRIVIVFIFWWGTVAVAQAQFSVKGTVEDSIDVGSMHHAVVSLLRPQDSILVRYARVDAQGRFLISVPDSGRYIMLFTYPNYADYVQEINLAQPMTDIGQIDLMPKSRLLAEVIVKQQVASIKIKGDTTEFTADSFKVQPDATVEDLLKKIPSIQVDKNGKITAQGQSVPKILVDGEEFFGDDPTLVTKNLRADMVDKVQVYDKKSDQAAFTGIEDGERTKTINLKLKEDKKKGYFGKASLAGGTKGFHENQAMVNKFQKKEKISAFGIVSNTGKIGLNWGESDRYGGNAGITETLDDGSTVTYFMQSEDDRWDGNGIPLTQTGGLHYNNKWNDDKQSVNANARTARLSTNGTTITTTQNNLPTTINYSNNYSNNKTIRTKHKGDVTYNQDFDSSFSMKITASASLRHTLSDATDSTMTLRADSSFLNSNYRHTTTDGDNNNFNGTLSLQKN